MKYMNACYIHVLQTYMYHACHYYYNMYDMYTVDGEKLAGLNIHSFSAIKVLAEILPCCLGHKCSLFSTIKERRLYLQNNFHGIPDNRENVQV